MKNLNGKTIFTRLNLKKVQKAIKKRGYCLCWVGPYQFLPKEVREEFPFSGDAPKEEQDKATAKVDARISELRKWAEDKSPRESTNRPYTLALTYTIMQEENKTDVLRYCAAGLLREIHPTDKWFNVSLDDALLLIVNLNRLI